MGRLNTVEEFNDIIIANVNGVPIRLSDIGRVDDTFEEPRNISRLDGENAVSLLVRRQSGTNTVKVIETIKKKMDVLKSALPSDIKMEVVRDRSRFIKKSYNEVMGPPYYRQPAGKYRCPPVYEELAQYPYISHIDTCVNNSNIHCNKVFRVHPEQHDYAGSCHLHRNSY